MKKTVLSLTKPRPEWAKWTFKIFFWATSSISIILNTLTFIDPVVKSQINEGVIAANLIVNALSHVVGIETK